MFVTIDRVIREAFLEEVTFELRLKDEKIWGKSVSTGAQLAWYV